MLLLPLLIPLPLIRADGLFHSRLVLGLLSPIARPPSRSSTSKPPFGRLSSRSAQSLSFSRPRRLSRTSLRTSTFSPRPTSSSPRRSLPPLVLSSPGPSLSSMR